MMYMDVPEVLLGIQRFMSGSLDYQIIWSTFRLHVIWVEKARGDKVSEIVSLFV